MQGDKVAKKTNYLESLLVT